MKTTFALRSSAEKRLLLKAVCHFFTCVCLSVGWLVLPNVANGAVLDLSSATTDALTVENATNTDPKAFDGNTSTRWASASGQGDNTWIWVDLGSDLTLRSVAVDWEVADATTYKLYRLTNAEATSIGFVGDGSDAVNLANWATIASVTDVNDAAAHHAIDTFDFVNDTVSLTRGVGPGTATIDVHAPSVRYLLTNPISDKDIHGGVSIFEVTVDAVPEPATLALAAVGLLGLRRRRRKA